MYVVTLSAVLTAHTGSAISHDRISVSHDANETLVGPFLLVVGERRGIEFHHFKLDQFGVWLSQLAAPRSSLEPWWGLRQSTGVPRHGRNSPPWELKLAAEP